MLTSFKREDWDIFGPNGMKYAANKETAIIRRGKVVRDVCATSDLGYQEITLRIVRSYHVLLGVPPNRVDSPW